MSPYILSLLLLLAIWLYWGVYYTLFLTKMFNENLKYLLEQNPNKMKSCPQGARYDAINLNYWKLLIGGIFILPIRSILMLPILLSCWGWNFAMMTIYEGNSQ